MTLIHDRYDPPQRLLNAAKAAAMPSPWRAADGWSDHFANCSSRSNQDAWHASLPQISEQS